jgi:branched-chain amino acid transport system ATP-binding protein
LNLLDVSGIGVLYGDMIALQDVSITVQQGEPVTVLGANAAGKSTLLRAISGLIPISGGTIVFNGEAIERLPAHTRVEMGLIQVPEGRMLFPFLSVEDNLRLGAFTARARSRIRNSLERVYAMFPKLTERRTQMAGSLSGGEQQMVALGRGLMAQPRLLMLDEPSLGLAPLLVQEVMERIAAVSLEGITVLIVEQNVNQTLKFAHRGYVLENGRLVLAGSAAELRASDEVRRAYLGM